MVRHASDPLLGHIRADLLLALARRRGDHGQAPKDPRRRYRECSAVEPRGL